MDRRLTREYPQRELIFHDTVPLPPSELNEHRVRAVRQKEEVLNFFKDRYPRNYTPSEVCEALKRNGSYILLTSVRRSITDLTKEGRLQKCVHSESRKGQYGTLNRTWKYNDSYVSSLNIWI